MLHYEREYGTARGVFAVLEFAGWAAVLLGVLAALVAGLGGSQAVTYYGSSGWGILLLAVLPGLGVAIGGIFAVAQAQAGRAHVDTAEMTRELLKLARQSAIAPARSEPPVAAPQPPASSPPVPVERPQPPEVKTAEPPVDRAAFSDTSPWTEDPAFPDTEDGEVAVGSYRSVNLSLRRDGYYAGGQRFESRAEVQEAIDEVYRRRQQRGL